MLNNFAQLSVWAQPNMFGKPPSRMVWLAKGGGVSKGAVTQVGNTKRLAEGDPVVAWVHQRNKPSAPVIVCTRRGPL